MNPFCRTENDWDEELCSECGESLTHHGEQDRYRAFGYIGVGRFGVAYVGMQFSQGEDVDPMEDGNLVVIKSVIPDAVCLAELEAQALYELSPSSWFPRFIDAFAYGNRPYIAQEWIDGRPLSRLLEKSGSLSEKKTVKILTGVFTAVRELHSRGILHRDIQPANIMLRKVDDGVIDPVIIDFGLAYFRHEVHTEHSPVLGCKLYTPIEQYRDEPNCRSDIFAIGITGAELLGADPELLALREGPFPPFRRQLEKKGVSQPLISFLERCTMIDHADRLPNCDAALAILKKIARGVGRKNWRKLSKAARHERLASMKSLSMS